MCKRAAHVKIIKSVTEGETTAGDENIYSKGEFIFEM
jgi:hypothetical protein